jgi:hypothetical protein
MIYTVPDAHIHHLFGLFQHPARGIIVGIEMDLKATLTKGTTRYSRAKSKACL